MKNHLIVFIIIVFTAITGSIFIASIKAQPSPSAQEMINKILAERKENSRLQLQGEIREPGIYRILAICDVGNGTMIYLGVWYSGPTSMEIVQGGCAKARAEK